ncbi:IS701 family transposase [Micromonospora sp. NBC_01796]|uniref:IS701 family transposase n=1 Tax=Micromonospora sp. NBC_01796 TaxID=2975987 RepID=UPI002DD864D1|nr:IS701 family transposase [Micromonospora sp. NBC_01796]WSA86028.1 IS701 family transposase [Micromonospora sp. NBC_01796]
MDEVEVRRLRDDLADFVGDVFGSLTRVGWQDRAASYLQGLMIDGRRKSIQPMAGRLDGVHDQALNHFVTNSPWDVNPVRARLAQRMDTVIRPLAWAVDDTGWLKCGSASPAVARQYTGTAGKVTNCQIGVSVNLVTDTASCPANWRLFLPAAWDPDTSPDPDVDRRRTRAGIPDKVRHREKWRLALDMIDELTGWGLRAPLIVADAGYGDAAEFRHGLTERDIPYVVQVSTNTGVHRHDTVRTTPPYQGVGKPPTQRYRQPTVSVKDLVLTDGQARTVAWRNGSRIRGGKPVKMQSRFVFLRVRPAGRVLLTEYRGQDLPEAWLIAEWPTGHDEPTKYWLSNLPTTTPKRTLIRWAKLRWRIEHDYRELKTGLGLDHYEGRTWQGWHHHVTLVSAAHAFCTLQRLHHPKAATPA